MSGQLLGYERIQEIHDRVILLAGEMLLQRRPFRWLLDGAVVSNAYESCDMASVMADNNLTEVCKLSEDLVVVKKAGAK